MNTNMGNAKPKMAFTQILSGEIKHEEMDINKDNPAIRETTNIVFLLILNFVATFYLLKLFNVSFSSLLKLSYPDLEILSNILSMVSCCDNP